MVSKAKTSILNWSHYTWGLALTLLAIRFSQVDSLTKLGAFNAYLALGAFFVIVFKSHVQPRVAVVTTLFSLSWTALILQGFFDWGTTATLSASLAALWSLLRITWTTQTWPDPGTRPDDEKSVHAADPCGRSASTEHG